MNESSNNNRPGRRRRARRRKLLTVIVLLLLCVLAAVYILVHFGKHNSNTAQEPAAETPAAEETAETPEEAAGTPEKDAEAAERAASHVYSHRGSAGEDELTMAAYDRAVEAGSKYIEADIVVSENGTIYLSHDDNVIDMTGVNGYISGMVDSQIDGLKTKSGSNIVKLKELFDKYGDSVTYLVDIKYTSYRNIEAFTDIVKEYGFENNVIATSAYFDALRPLEDTFPDMPKLYVCSDQGTFALALDHDYVDIISVPKDLMTSDNLKAARDHGKKFSAWTLNTEKEITDAIALGVDAYFTDDSGLAIKLEEEYRTE